MRQPPDRPLLCPENPTPSTVPSLMLLAGFGDAHAHKDALDAVMAAARRHGADELWSLGDMIGAGPDADHVVAATRAHCTVALMGNHDYGATGGVALDRLGDPASANA